MPADTASLERELAAASIDPRYPLQAATELLAVAGDDEALAERLLGGLLELAVGLAREEIELYSPLGMSLPPVVKACAGDADAILARMDDLLAVGAAMKRADQDPVMFYQRGAPSTARAAAAESRPFVVELGLQLARDLAGRRLDPTRMLELALPAFAPTRAAADRAALAELIAALRGMIDAMDERGIGPHWPIGCALASMAEAFSEDPPALREAMDELAELAIAIHNAGHSPYPVLEYGVTAAVEAARGAEWLLPEALPLGIALAAAGGNPHQLLQGGVRALASLDPETGGAILARARASAERGVDPGTFLEHCLWHALSATSEDEAARERILDRVDELLAAIVQAEERIWMTFERGLPPVLWESRADAWLLERILELGIAYARAGIDPGPRIQFGLSVTIAVLAERRPQLERAIRLAHEQIAAGIDPWRVLEYGVPAVADLAGEDDDAFGALLAKLDALVRALHDLGGVDIDHVITYGVHPIAQKTRGERALFESFLDGLSDLARDLSAHGIDPAQVISRGLPEVAGATHGAPALVERVLGFARAVGARGVDPGPLLAHAVPPMLKRADLDEARVDALLDDVAATVGEIAAKEIAPATGLEEALAAVCESAGEDAEAALGEALGLLRRLAEGGLDGSTAVRHGFAPLAARPAEERAPAVEAIESLVRRAAERALDADAICRHALPAAADVAATHGPYARVLDGVLEASARIAAAGLAIAAVLPEAARPARAVAGGRAEVFTRLVAAIADRACALHADGHDLARVLSWAGRRAANVAGEDEKALVALLEPLARVAALREGDGGPSEGLLEHALPLAGLAGGDPKGFEAAIDDLVRLHASGALGDEEVYYRLRHLTELVRRLPQTFRGLIVPAIQGQGPGAPSALAAIRWLADDIEDDEAIALLRHVVTQEGVRALDILGGLLIDGRRTGAIRSLSAERETLLGFLRDVPFSDPEYYVQYKKIVADEALGAADKRREIEQLHASVEELTGAIHAGELSRQQEEHPLFAQVLYHVFPPAYTVSRESYRALYHRFADHAEQLARFTGPGGVDAAEARLSLGAYHFRAGVEVDLAAWKPALDAVRRVNASSPSEEPLAALGRSIFEKWIAGEIGKERARDEVLGRIYAYHLRTAGAALPDEADDPTTLLKYRELLADTAKEIIQDALRAHRETDPERYEQQARAKLAPRAHVGKGLARAVWRTVEQHRAGEIDAQKVRERLARQLRGFDLEGPGGADRLLAASDREALEAALDALPRAEAEVELGDEHLRVLADLAGQQIAAMQRELFGEGKSPGKVEYRRAEGGPELVIRLQVTKRRAHAPVGYCEGVCTAPDQKLWDRPEFFQVVFWGEDRRALGGMHLLIVEQDGESFLTLPGINPSLALLKEVGAEAFLDEALAFAHRVAATWKLAGVWIPTHRGIFTNRGPVRDAILGREFEKKQIGSKQFSFSPYSYSFDEVMVVPPMA